MEVGQRFKELEAMERGPLMTLAKEWGVSSIPKKNNQELISEILFAEQNGAGTSANNTSPPLPDPPAEQPDKIEAGQIMDALVAELAKPYEKHSRRTYTAPARATVDLYWHEDLDEAMAIDAQEIHENMAELPRPIAAVGLNGRRGRDRKEIMGAIKRAMLKLGFEIRFKGVTWLG